MKEFYMFFMHPSVAADLMRIMTPKEKWKMQYRSERLRRQGMEPEKLIHGQLVRYESLRFIS